MFRCSDSNVPMLNRFCVRSEQFSELGAPPPFSPRPRPFHQHPAGPVILELRSCAFSVILTCLQWRQPKARSTRITVSICRGGGTRGHRALPRVPTRRVRRRVIWRTQRALWVCVVWRRWWISTGGRCPVTTWRRLGIALIVQICGACSWRRCRERAQCSCARRRHG